MTDDAVNLACKLAMEQEANRLMSVLTVIRTKYRGFLPALLDDVFNLRSVKERLLDIRSKTNIADKTLIETAELCRAIWEDLQRMENRIDALDRSADEALSKVDRINDGLDTILSKINQLKEIA